MPESSRLLVFDLSSHAHLHTYARFLIEAWAGRSSGERLDFVVRPAFVERHPDVLALADACANVRVLPIRADEQARRVRSVRLALDAKREAPAVSFADVLRGDAATEALSVDWQLLHAYARRLGAHRAFVVSLDAYLPLIAGGAELPCPVSGIFFAPTFHYARFDCGPETEEERARELHQRFLLARALRAPRLHRLFVLDPFAAEAAQGFPSGAKVMALPDPVPPNTATAEDARGLRARLGIEPGRAVLLCFGHLTARKGCSTVLEALLRLPDAICAGLALVLAGEPGAGYRAELEALADRVAAERPVQIVRRLAFVPQDEVSRWFRMADVVLAPYPRHAGMSGVVLLAAAAGVPVLSSSFGLMGEMVRRHRLGLAVDATDAGAVAEGIERLLAPDAPSEGLYDPDAMARLAREHDARRFGSILLDAAAS